jgi:hypothetical protein
MRPGKLGAALCLLMFLPWSAIPSGAQLPTPGQDWVIDTDTLVENETIWMNMNCVTVKAGATLELRNVTLNFNFTFQDWRGLLVEKDGHLIMDGCGFNTGVTDAQEAEFVVYGTADVSNSTLRYFDGATIRGPAANFTNTTFTCFHDYTYAIECENTNLTLRNCRFDASGGFADGPGINSDHSNVTVDGCIFMLVKCCIVGFSDYDVNLMNSDFVRYARTGGRNQYFIIDLYEVNATITNCTLGQPSREENASLCDWGKAPREEPQELIIRGCRFRGCTSAIEIGDMFDPFQLTGINVVGSRGHVYALGSRFNGLSFGIRSSLPDSVLCENNDFNRTGGQEAAIVSYMNFAGVDDFIIRNNSFKNVQAVDAKEMTFENNTINCSASNYAIRCLSSARIMNNNISASAPIGIYFGILASPNQDGVKLEISGNRITSVAEGIHMSDDGAFHPAEITIKDNLLDSVNNGIYFSGYKNGPGPFRVNISGNTIKSAEGIYLYWGKVVELSISDNIINTTFDGIMFRWAYPSNTSIIERNVFRGPDYGIYVDSGGFRIRNNTFIDIDLIAIHVIDFNEDVDNNTFVYSDDSFNGSLRILREWRLEAWVYNDRNYSNPQTQEDWVQCGISYIQGTDKNGFTAVSKSDFNGHGTFALPEYSIRWNGTRNESSPYLITASSTIFGVGHESVNLNASSNVSIYLRRGPDLLPVYLGFVNGTPLEGQSTEIFAGICNDGSNNPENWEPPYFDVALILDGTPLYTEWQMGFPSSGNAGIRTEWTATGGWHSLSLFVDSSNAVKEVYEDNNQMNLSFFVPGVPSGNIVSNGTDFETWMPVDFTVAPWPAYPDIQDFKYIFGDGNESDWLIAPNASHSYGRAGTYIISVRARSYGGQTGDCFTPLTITVRYPEPNLRGNASNPTPFTGQEVHFQANLSTALENVTACTWTFGDGEYIRGRDNFTISHAFKKVGDYKVTLEVEMDWGLTLNWSVLIRVQNTKPTVSVSVPQASGTILTLFEFFAVAQDPDGTIAAYNWSLGDGNRSGQPRTSHSYSHWGTYLVSLSVRDDLGEWSDTAYINVTVNNMPPTIGATVNRYSAQAGTKLSFDASGSRDADGNVSALMYRWDFGDGTNGRGMIVKHAYEKPGKYTVILSVMDDGALSSAKTFTITITEPPAAPVGDWLVPATLGSIAILVVVAAIFAVRYRAAHPPPPKLRPRPVKTVRPLKTAKKTVRTRKGTKPNLEEE